MFSNMQRRAKLARLRFNLRKHAASRPRRTQPGTGPGQHSQHHKTGEVLEGVVGDVADAVEGQGHGLQGREIVEGPDRDLRECIVVQPEVAEGGQPLKAPFWDQRDEVGI